MSVVGIDPGNDTSCVALARKRGVDVIMNKESKRETPSVVNFGDKMRFLGTDGQAKMSLSPQNTAHQLKRILGKRFQDPFVQNDISKLPFIGKEAPSGGCLVKVKEAPDGGCLVEVTYCNEATTFSPEQLMAIILVDQKRIAEDEEPERYAMLAAAKIAGLNCLRLINETTATALAYGIYKTDLSEEVAVNVGFVDVGHSSTQVTIVALKKTGMQVLAHAWDKNTGGRDTDEALFDHFAKDFQAKYKLDIRTNKKASFKLRQGVEKVKKILSANAEAQLNIECIMEDLGIYDPVKKILSANAEAQLNIECIMEDFDMRGQLSREQLEEIVAPVLARISTPIAQALADSKLQQSDISNVEIIGSATRTPAIFKIVEDAFGRSPSRTMNSKEAVSRGCALQCAMLSPVFKFTWPREGAEGETVSQTLFERNAPTPATKMLSLTRSAPFTITAVSPGCTGVVGHWNVGPFEIPAGAEKAKLKLRVKMDIHGLTTVESVHSVEEEEKKDTPMEEAAPASGGAEPMEAEAPAPAGDAAAAAPEKKKKLKKYEVPYTMVQLPLVRNTAEIEIMFEKECQMQASDRLQEETNERKNALEGYVYSLRNRLAENKGLGGFASAAEKENLVAAATAMEDWLYDEGEDVQKSVYVAKLDELKAQSAAVELRSEEAAARPAAVDALRKSIHAYMTVGMGDAPQFAHIDAEEKALVYKECESALNWIDEKEGMQKAQPKTADPAYLSADVSKKRDTLDRVCRPIASKPKPKPAPAPVPEPAKEEEAKPAEGEAADGPADGPEAPSEEAPITMES
eukprot:gene31136-6275_t